MATNPAVNFTVTDAKNALTDILEAFKLPENASKMQEAKESAGSSMLKMMQFVFPLATQIQMNIIPKYGFSGDGPGIIRFAQMVKAFEKDNDEICRLNTQLRSIALPLIPMPLSTANS